MFRYTRVAVRATVPHKGVASFREVDYRSHLRSSSFRVTQGTHLRTIDSYRRTQEPSLSVAPGVYFHETDANPLDLTSRNARRAALSLAGDISFLKSFKDISPAFPSGSCQAKSGTSGRKLLCS